MKYILKKSDIGIPDSVASMLYFSMVFIVFVLLFLFIYRLILENANSEKLLLTSNFELKKLTEQLQLSEEELQQTNEELVSQADLLHSSEAELLAQQKSLQQSLQALEIQSEELTRKNIQVEEANRYKSEFLSNMSHELRTPLNSILVLAKLLSDNKTNNLDEKQVEFTNVIYKSGNNLLMLINDILDLAKIESGKVELTIEKINIDELIADMQSMFSEVANEKRISFSIVNPLRQGISVLGDKGKLEQILRNLLSNAFKFTDEGGNISLEFSTSANPNSFTAKELREASQVLSIAVRDNGIGISEEEQKNIFDAFKQADGSISRKYGGTGLGLTITRELAKIMGGEIALQSEEGEGSTFTFFMPFNVKSSVRASPEILQQSYVTSAENTISKNILIVEDDKIQRLWLSNIIQNQYPYSRIYLAADGLQAYEMVLSNNFDCVILDMGLPKMNGEEVLEKLRQNKNKIPAVMVYTGNDPTPEQYNLLKDFAHGIVMKNPVSAERLILELNLLFNFSGQTMMPESVSIFDETPAKSKVQKPRRINNPVLFRHKTALLVDDDMRNIFVIKVLLEEYGMEVIPAYDGKEALMALEQNRNIDVVLMDIMMPEMDGYEATREIRRHARYDALPVIALTAKAMKGDREKCLEAGASEYISKPVDSDELVEVIMKFLKIAE